MSDVEENQLPDDDAGVYVISVAAEISGMHPQTLRQYDKLGLVSPSRTEGRNRRYSLRDIALLRAVQKLVGEGINHAGIKRIIELESAMANMAVEVQVPQRVDGKALDALKKFAEETASEDVRVDFVNKAKI